MTDREILSNAIDKAITNGFILLPMYGSVKDEDVPLYPYHYCAIIFSHSFAKAFFGTKHLEGKTDKYICVDDPGTGVWFDGSAWLYHIQEMVKKENPIKYLKKFL